MCFRRLLTFYARVRPSLALVMVVMVVMVVVVWWFHRSEFSSCWRPNHFDDESGRSKYTKWANSTNVQQNVGTNTHSTGTLPSAVCLVRGHHLNVQCTVYTVLSGKVYSRSYSSSSSSPFPFRRRWRVWLPLTAAGQYLMLWLIVDLNYLLKLTGTICGLLT